jgi:hypothetical protein
VPRFLELRLGLNCNRQELQGSVARNTPHKKFKTIRE